MGRVGGGRAADRRGGRDGGLPPFSVRYAAVTPRRVTPVMPEVWSADRLAEAAAALATRVEVECGRGELHVTIIDPRALSPRYGALLFRAPRVDSDARSPSTWVFHERALYKGTPPRGIVTRDPISQSPLMPGWNERAARRGMNVRGPLFFAAAGAVAAALIGSKMYARARAAAGFECAVRRGKIKGTRFIF